MNSLYRNPYHLPPHLKGNANKFLNAEMHSEERRKEIMEDVHYYSDSDFDYYHHYDDSSYGYDPDYSPHECCFVTSWDY